MTAPLHIMDIRNAYKRAQTRLIVLDFDGTLVPFEIHPSMVTNPPEVDALLRSLASDPKNEVIVISGRTQVDLDTILGNLPISTGAEHGAFMKGQKGWKRMFPLSPPSVMMAAMALNHLANLYENTYVELKLFSIAWHYRALAGQIPQIHLRKIVANLETLAMEEGFVLEHSEFTIELRTPGIDKGAAVSKWLGNREFDFVLALGDSLTDESLFQLPGPLGYAIHVGQSNTSCAGYHLPAQKDVVPFLETLVGKKRIEVDVPHQISL